MGEKVSLCFRIIKSKYIPIKLLVKLAKLFVIKLNVLCISANLKKYKMLGTNENLNLRNFIYALSKCINFVLSQSYT